MTAMLTTVRTPTLEIACDETGPGNGAPVILLHGFPDDSHAYDDVTPVLAEAGYRVLVPWLRGYGATRFLDASTPRSGQQAALGADLLAFMDALGLQQATLAGYDWGGRAACIVSALWPRRVRGLVTCGGYNLQDIAASGQPGPAAAEYRMWYQWYFHTERGSAGLEQNRREIARLLWRLWSPNYDFDDATFERTAVSFDNPDFVEVVVHSYRHRHRAAEGDPERWSQSKRSWRNNRRSASRRSTWPAIRAASAHRLANTAPHYTSPGSTNDESCRTWGISSLVRRRKRRSGDSRPRACVARVRRTASATACCLRPYRAGCRHASG